MPVIQLSVVEDILYKIWIELNWEDQRNVLKCVYGVSRRIHIGKYLPFAFPIYNGLKQKNALSLLLFNIPLEYSIMRTTVAQSV